MKIFSTVQVINQLGLQQQKTGNNLKVHSSRLCKQTTVDRGGIGRGHKKGGGSAHPGAGGTSKTALSGKASAGQRLEDTHWRKREETQVLGIQNGTASLETSLIVSCKVKRILPILTTQPRGSPR